MLPQCFKKNFNNSYAIKFRKRVVENFIVKQSERRCVSNSLECRNLTTLDSLQNQYPIKGNIDIN